ncbi:MAG: type II toxin-antitoxin system prevent-host-death family antitoxin [Vicinamibacterales bacterium]
MTEKVSTMDVRARIGDMLNRVSLRHDEFIIERKGKPLAALVPVERLEQMRRFARQHALEFLERQKQGPGNELSDDEAMAVALEAQREARERRRKTANTKSKPKRSRK